MSTGSVVSAAGVSATQVVLTETLGTKLRRLASRANGSNPIVNLPWTNAPAWVGNTAYLPGTVVTNSGNQYCCITGGTSAASGGPTGSSNTGIADGTVAWSYYGQSAIAANDPNAPTLTNSSTGLTNTYNPGLTPNSFRMYGGTPSVFATNYWKSNVFTSNITGPVISGNGSRVAFETDAPAFGIFGPSNVGAFAVTIDDRQFNVGGFPPPSGGQYYRFDFGATSNRRTRRVSVEFSSNGIGGTALGTVGVDTNSQVWAPTASDDIRAIFISDSLWAGSAYGPMIPGMGVPNRVAKLLGWTDPWNFSTGGTGWIATGGGNYTFGQRIPQALALNPDVFLFMGSTNDFGQSAAAITAAALSTFQSIRAGGSTAPIIVFGVWSLNNAAVPTVENAVNAAVTQFNDPLGKTFFIPIYGDPVLPWVTGAWNNTANTNSTNSALYIAGDNTHPIDIGTAYLAQRIARSIQNSVLPNLK